jgi:hypothetical protein
MAWPPSPSSKSSFVRAGIARWRSLGPRHGTAAALRAGAAAVPPALRRARLRIRPLRVGDHELQEALGRLSPVDALRGPALAAMPTVADLERGLDELDEEARADLLARGEDLLAHRFDLLGSGPTELGPEIDWLLDFKTGRRWPLLHISRLPFTYFDGSDIKVPWEL